VNGFGFDCRDVSADVPCIPDNSPCEAGYGPIRPMFGFDGRRCLRCLGPLGDFACQGGCGSGIKMVDLRTRNDPTILQWATASRVGTRPLSRRYRSRVHAGIRAGGGAAATPFLMSRVGKNRQSRRVDAVQEGGGSAGRRVISDSPSSFRRRPAARASRFSAVTTSTRLGLRRSSK